jgi:hypothetical protein
MATPPPNVGKASSLFQASHDGLKMEETAGHKQFVASLRELETYRKVS